MHSNPKSRFRPGFTLMEILVTITIIVVLAAIVFNVSRSLRTAAKAVGTANNLRQCGITMVAVRENGIDVNGLIPPGFFPGYSGYYGPPRWNKYVIYDLIGEQAGFCEYSNGKYKWNVHPIETFLRNPLSEFELGNGEKDRAKIDLTNNQLQCKGSFGYNHHINGWSHANSTEGDGHYKRHSLSNINHPEWTILMGEQAPIGAGFIIGPGNQAPQGSYKDSAHVLFVDGHVELLTNDYLKSETARKKNFEVPGMP